MTKGKQCRRQTCYTLPWCWQHLKKHAKLKIGRTRLVDPVTNQRFTFRGLFACDPRAGDTPVFRRGDLITPYIGEQITEAQADAMYGDNANVPYGMDTEDTSGNDVVIDAGSMRGVGAFANDKHKATCVPGSRCSVNAKLWSSVGNYPDIHALKNIYDGDEILVSYGRAYWEGEETQHRTTPSGAYNRLEYKC